MSHTQHTPEPWHVLAADYTTGHNDQHTGYNIVAGADHDITICNITLNNTDRVLTIRNANAARIVACVNACKGVSNEWLQENGVQERIEEIQSLKRRIADLQEQLIKITNNH